MHAPLFVAFPCAAAVLKSAPFFSIIGLAAACATRAAALNAAQVLGYPVVAKILSPDITHKTEVGGVRLNLADADALGQAFDQMTADAACLRPGARIDGVLVAPMLSGGVETIAGATVAFCHAA